MADKSFWSNKKDKTWFKNFWYYYKIHIYVLIAVILVTGYTVRECAKKVNPDISINFVAEKFLSKDAVNSITEYFKPLINDVDGKDGNNVTVVQYTVSDSSENGTDMQMAVAMREAILLELALGESYIYIVDDTQIELFKQSEVLLDLSEISDLPKNTYSLDIQNNKLFSELTNITFDCPVHLCVRTLTESLSEKDIKRAKAQQENAIIIFNEFYKYNEVTE